MSTADSPRHHQQIVAREQGLARQLSQRQLGMIAIGGAIGTGLFLGSALAVRTAGPGVIFELHFCGYRHAAADGMPWRNGGRAPHCRIVRRLCRALSLAMGRVHGSLYLLGGAVHRYRRRGGCSRYLHAVVVSKYAGVGVGLSMLRASERLESLSTGSRRSRWRRSWFSSC